MKKITMLIALLVCMSWQISAQTSTLYLSTSGGCCASEKWVEITDGPNGTGTVLWAQGDGTYGNGAGYLTDSSFTVTNGTTYYISCYDRYDDSWDGTTYEIRTAAAGGGVLVANNGGVSPDNGTDTDATSAFETRADERESDESFSYTPATCAQPTALTASVTPTTADLSWTEAGTATAWEIEWGTSGFTQGSGTALAASGNPHSLTGLTANTSYDFYVRAGCGAADSSLWSGPYNFSTPCVASTTPVNEGFESGYTDQVTLAGCLIQESESGSGTWVANSSATSYNRTPRTGSFNATLRYSNTDWIFVPVSLVSGTSYTADVYARQDGSNTSNASLMIAYGSSATAAGMTDTIVSPAGLDDNYQLLSGMFTPTSTGVFYIGFKGLINGSPWYISIDDISIYNTPNCVMPSAGVVTNVNTTSADLGWTENGTATAWEIEWDTAGFTQGSGTAVAASGNPHSLTGLTANTSYDFYVRAGCGAADSSLWSGPYNFSTPCVASTTPVNEGFESGYTDQVTLAGCLIQESESGSGTWVANSSATSYNRTPRTGSFNATLRYSNTDWIFVPVSLVSGTSYTADVYARQDGSNTSNASLMIAYGSSATAAGMTDTIVSPAGLDDNYQLLSGMFTPTSTGVFYIGFKGLINGSPWYISIDDISIYNTPNCVMPSAGVVTNVNTTSADLGWTENGTATAWEIEWDTAGFTQGSGTAVAASGNPHSLTGLTANTSYEFFVRAGCGATDSSTWAGPYSFTTSCGAVTSFPYSENFDGTLNNDVWSCWTVINNDNDSYTWRQGNTYITPTHSTPYAAYGSGNGDDYLITPQLTVGATAIRVKFWDKVESASYNNTYSVWVSTTGTNVSDFTDSITTIDCSNTAWMEHVISLSAYTNQSIYVAFHQTYSGSSGWGFGIDDFTAEEIPSCTEPDSLMASNETTSGADLYWNEAGTATLWDLEIVASGATPTGTPTNTGVTSDSVTISNLSHSTSYDYYVRADCGGATSPWTGPYTFNTVCGAVTTFPYTENFDGSLNNGVWNCWSVVNNDNDSYTWSQANTYISPTKSGTFAAHGMGNSDDYLISPQLTVGATAIRVTFWDKVESATRNNTYTIRVSTTGTNPADFTDSITTIDCSNTNWVEHIVDLTSYTNQSIYVAFHQTFSGSTFYGFGIDDFTAELIPTCPKPNSLMAGSITDVSAQLSWTETGSATAWEIEYDTVGFTPGTGTIAAASSNPFTLTSLSANTSYEYYVRAVCGAGDSSVWVGPLSFATNPPAISSFPYINDMESGLGLYLALTDDVQSSASLDSTAANGAGIGVLLTGGGASGWTGGSTGTTETQAFVDNVTHVSSVKFLVDGTSQTNLHMSFDFRQEATYGVNYSWGRILVNGNVLAGSAVTPSTTDSDPFVTVEFDLSAYSGTIFSVELQHSGKYNVANGTGNRGDEAHIDNLKLYDAMIPSMASVGATCFNGNDGTATVTVTGGYSPYSYSWSNGDTTAMADTLMAGDYYVTVTDSFGFEIMDTATVSQGAALALNLGNDTSVCVNAALTLDAGTFTSYLWDDASTMQTRATVNTAAGATNYSVTVTDGNGCSAVDTIEVTVMADPIVDLGNDTSICDGAMLTLDAGSFATYAWDDASTMQTRMVSSVLGASTYSVTVTNVAGCSGSDDIVVTGYAPVMVNLGNDTSVCHGVSLTLDAGTFTSYLWDDASTMQTRMTVSTVGAVDYSVEVTDANGCTGNDTIEVTGLAMPMVDLGNDTTLCDGETITLDAGTFTSYLWDDASTMQTRMTVSTVGAVDYSVEVTDANGCTANDTIEVTGDAPVMVDLGPDTALCNGADYTLDAGAGFATYFWNNGFNTQTLDVGSTTAGTMTYVVAVTNAAGCMGRDTAIISVNTPVVVDLGPDTNIWQPGTTEITLDAGAGFASYLWSDNVTTTQTYVVQQSNSGSVYVVVEDANGCTGTDTVVVKFVLGVDEFNASALKMYPNPAVDQVTVELSNFNNANEVNVTFLTVSGQVVMSKRVNVSGDVHTETFNVSSLATGSYLVKFEANGETVVRQFIIK
ncbi:MAG: choice-of-anchor J domain-containing protein [Salibacteraceae bacterium]